MTIIENYGIEVNQIGPIDYLIEVITPDKLKFVGHCQFPPGLTPEIAYNEIWKKNYKRFTLDLESEIVKNEQINK